MKAESVVILIKNVDCELVLYNVNILLGLCKIL